MDHFFLSHHKKLMNQTTLNVIVTQLKVSKDFIQFVFLTVGVKVTVRGCQTGPAPFIGCQSGSSGGITGTGCFCTNNLCNGRPIVQTTRNAATVNSGYIMMVLAAVSVGYCTRATATYTSLDRFL